MAAPAIEPGEGSDYSTMNNGGMTDEDLAAALAREERSAVTYRDSAIAADQANAIDFYEAQPFGDEEEGRSQIVTPDVAEVVDYMAISVQGTCASGDRVVEFEAILPDQDEFARQATEAVSNAFMHDQDGYKIMFDWLQSGLIEKIGVVKTACVTEKRNKRERVMVSHEQLAALDSGMHDGVKLLDYADNGDGSFTARTQRQITRKRYQDFPVPSEEFLFAPRTKHEDETDYIAQRSRKTLSDLLEMGFDRELIDDLPIETGQLWGDSRTYARWSDETYDGLDRVGSMRQVELLEEYVRMDRDGDGIAELLKVFRVADRILEVEEVDEQPFVVFCPYPRAHRMVGNALADKVMDIQRIRSTLVRQNLDGVYLANRPRAQIPEDAIGENTIDDWLTEGPGVLIRTGRGGEIVPLTDGFDISRGLGMLEFMTGERESRTGITRLNQGIGADALNKTATGTALMQAQGQQHELAVSRWFASALGRLFAKKLRLMHAEGDPLFVKLDGEMQKVDPSQWDPDMVVKIKVGLGTGNKDKRISMVQTLTSGLVELKMGGSPMVTDQNLYNLISIGIRDMDIGLPSQYLTDPTTVQPPEPKPDPAMAKVQSDAQLAAQKQAADENKAQQAHALASQQIEADAEAKQQASAVHLQIKTHEANLSSQLAHAKAAGEAGLAEQKAQFEANQTVAQFDFDKHLALLKHDHNVAMAEKALPTLRPGGDLSK
jgi:hypothetical protein